MAERGRRVRPVEQEAGQHEEDGDPDVEAGEHRARDALAHPAEEGDVDQQDAERGDGAQAVQRRDLPAGGGG
jgi:hypothetical protein